MLGISEQGELQGRQCNKCLTFLLLMSEFVAQVSETVRCNYGL